jgi:hypothetical protein
MRSRNATHTFSSGPLDGVDSVQPPASAKTGGIRAATAVSKAGPPQAEPGNGARPARAGDLDTRREKIAEVRRAYREGRFQVDAEAVADRLLKEGAVPLAPIASSRGA